MDDGWIWGMPISHEVYERAVKGDWDMVLTPTKPVPKSWFPQLSGSRILGLASGGGQQMPIFAACGGICITFLPCHLSSLLVHHLSFAKQFLAPYAPIIFL